MKNYSKGFVWLLPLIIVLIVGVGGVVGWEAVKERRADVKVESEQTNKTENTSTSNNSSVTNNASDNTESRLEFPWGDYNSSVNVTASSINAKSIGSTVNVGGFSKGTLVIAKSASIGGASNVGSAYIFDSLNLAANAKIDNLYVESGTSLNIGTGATIGKKTVLSHNDLVRAAEKAAGITVEASATVNTNVSAGSSSTSPTPTPTPSPTPSSVSATSVTTVADFAGEWSGTYSSSSLSGSACKAAGGVSMSVTSSGAASGYITYTNGIKATGTGKVDGSGNLTGAWKYSGLSLSFSGKLKDSTNSGTGTYIDNLGCNGSFSLSR